MENVKEWINSNNDLDFGCGFGSKEGGDGYGTCDGSGSGKGAGNVDFGIGFCDESGLSSGCGNKSGCGYGFDCMVMGGSCLGGYGHSKCSNDCVTKYNGQEVFNINGISTILTRIRDSIAMGFILKSDFTLDPCYITKGNGYFAHCKTLKEAKQSLMGDLISKKAVLNIIRRGWSNHYSCKDMCDEIEAIPTAYNLDKILKQLEELGIDMEKQAAGIGSNHCKKYFGMCAPGMNCYVCVMKEAIEIVKGGGSDDRFN